MPRCFNDSAGDGTDEFSSGQSSKEQADAPAPRWHYGCFAYYKLGICQEQTCSYLHDLSAQDAATFLRDREQSRHEIFSDKSSQETSGASAEASNTERVHRSQPESASSMGNLLSVGSAKHADGTCKPCRFIILGQSCHRGFGCRFCHIQHKELSALAQPDSFHVMNATKARPSKAKRTRYKEIAQKMEAEVLQDPFGWSPDSVRIPVELSKKPDVKQKLLIRLATKAEMARSSQNRGTAVTSANRDHSRRSNLSSTSSSNESGGLEPSTERYQQRSPHLSPECPKQNQSSSTLPTQVERGPRSRHLIAL